LIKLNVEGREKFERRFPPLKASVGQKAKGRREKEKNFYAPCISAVDDDYQELKL
jgi:hypothetical protein